MKVNISQIYVKEKNRNSCPHCKSISVIPGNTDPGNEDFINKGYRCKECGCEFYHVYRLKYANTIINTNVSEIPDKVEKK